MDDLSDLCYEYIEQGLYWSALTLGEYIYNVNSSIDTLYDILIAMYHLNFDGQVVEIFERNKEIQNIFELRKIYFKCLKKPSCIKLQPNLTNYHRKPPKIINLKKESILKIYEQKSKNKKESLIHAFQLDQRNLEALIFLFRENLISYDSLISMVESVDNKELCCVYNSIFREDVYCTYIFSPLSFFKKAKKLYYEKKSDQLFLFGTSLIKGYSNCEYSYFILGMYFLLKNMLVDARACFYQSIKINENFGEGWIAYGIVNSSIKDCMNATSCFETAYDKMPGSYKPSLYLGYEYHITNNYELADIWYKKSLEMKKNSVIVQKYSSFLISTNRIEEAVTLLDYQNTLLEEEKLRNGDLLICLKVFCLISKNQFKEAETLLKKCKESWRTLVLFGFIKQCQNNLEEAIVYFHDSLIKSNNNNYIEDILTHALDVSNEKSINFVNDYSNILFEALDLKSLGIVFI